VVHAKRVSADPDSAVTDAGTALIHRPAMTLKLERMTTFKLRTHEFPRGGTAPQRIPSRIVIAAMIVASGCSVASCGGDSSPKSAPTATTSTTIASPDDLSTRVGEICDEWKRALDARPRFAVENFDPEHPDPQLLPDVGSYFAPSAELQQDAIDQLEAFDAPGPGQRDLDALVVALRAEVTNTRAQVDAANHGAVDDFKATVARVATLRAAVKRAAKPFKADGCAFG
jgi:hypothetical protein